MKRARTEQNQDGYSSNRTRKAIAISARIRKAYPYQSFGRAYYKRGSPASLGAFGPSFKDADAVQRQTRRDLGFTGRGMYMGGKGGYWGRKIGGWFGVPDLGDKLGDLGSAAIRTLVPGGGMAMDAANAASSIMQGRGSYSVSNQLVGGAGPIPSFVASPDGATVRISHKEYIGDVFAPDLAKVFTNTFYAINPGVERTFPWLSQIAMNYDEYTLHQLMFTFRSTVADFAANSGQIGQVIAATQYNASSDPFSDKTAMMQYDSAMSCKTSETMVHGVECDPSKLSGTVGRYVRFNPVLSGQDINQYDHGQFNIAVTETPANYANQSMGELWISYTVELRKPKYFANRGLGISRDVFVGLTTATAEKMFTAPFLKGQQNNVGCALIPFDGSNIPSGLTNVSVDPSNATGIISSGGEAQCGGIIFPANYTGSLRVSLRVCTSAATTAQGAVYAWSQGNIFTVKDVIGTVTDLWLPGAQAADLRTHTMVFDIRVVAASNGVQNTILFSYDPQSTSGYTVTNFTLDIQEFNFGLSYKQDGSNDSLVLVDSAGQIQTV